MFQCQPQGLYEDVVINASVRLFGRLKYLSTFKNVCEMNFACFKVYDTNCQVATLSPWNSFFFLPFPYLLQMTLFFRKQLTKSLFLKISNCWSELGSAEHPYQVVSVCDCDKLSLRSLK